MVALATARGEKNVRLGAYDVTGFIAQGGMGSVFEARHRVTGARRALKVIRPDLARDHKFVERFIREVKLAASIRHPNLVEVYEPGMDGESVFLPMELLRGETLGALLARSGPLSPADVATLMLSVCRGVAAIHQRRILHRDLKPLNILLALVDGNTITPKVLDFGTARELEDTEHTSAGVVVGSPYYMAPEQAAGQKDLDSGVDQYALAAIGYHCLTGRRVHEGENHGQVLSRLLRNEPYPDVRDINHEVPDAMATAIRRGLAYRRSDRFPHVAAFGMALAAPLAEFLGNASAVRALTGRELDLMVTVPQELGGGAPAMSSEQAAEASDILERLDSSCVISVRPTASMSEPLAGQDGTLFLSSLDDSCVEELDGGSIEHVPDGGGTVVLEGEQTGESQPLGSRQPDPATLAPRGAEEGSIVVSRRSLTAVVAVVVGAGLMATLAVAAAIVLVGWGEERAPERNVEPGSLRLSAPEPAGPRELAPPGPADVAPSAPATADAPRGSVARPAPPAAPETTDVRTAAPGPGAITPAAEEPATVAPARSRRSVTAPDGARANRRGERHARERRAAARTAPAPARTAPDPPRPPPRMPTPDVGDPCTPTAGIPCM